MQLFQKLSLLGNNIHAHVWWDTLPCIMCYMQNKKNAIAFGWACYFIFHIKAQCEEWVWVLLDPRSVKDHWKKPSKTTGRLAINGWKLTLSWAVYNSNYYLCGDVNSTWMYSWIKELDAMVNWIVRCFIYMCVCVCLFSDEWSWYGWDLTCENVHVCGGFIAMN